MKEPININSDTLDKFLENDLGGFLSESKKITSSLNNVDLSSSELAINNYDALSISNSIQSFLSRGETVLETMQLYCNNMPDPESVNAFSALITALSSAINNIAAVQNKLQDHKNRLELEEHKHNLKLKEIEFREKIKQQNKQDTPGDLNNLDKDTSTTNLLKFNTSSIIEQITKVQSEQIN